jgi:hypothetical protein
MFCLPSNFCKICQKRTGWWLPSKVVKVDDDKWQCYRKCINCKRREEKDEIIDVKEFERLLSELKEVYQIL